ncbi:MAG: RluA family pseudouridine synthase [Clostridiales bacterium]|nr:RluA family pseudouridine synthase [Clostridiales bacterium]
MQKKTTIVKANARLDVSVSELCQISRSQAAKWVADGQCTVWGKVQTKASFQVVQDDELTVLLPLVKDCDIEAEDIPLQILYEDQDLVAVVKPSGMVVHPAAGNESGTLVNALLFAIKDLSGIGGEKRPGIVHRLDKDTSGLLLVAKNDAAHLSLSNQLMERSMEKHYLAVVNGEMKDVSGQVDAPIARSKRDRKKMAIDQDGRDAITDWMLLENLKHAALLDVHILTGRTHQIRVHMQSLHRPVLGDVIYGPKKGAQASRLMLHAYSLAFDHPRTGERIRLFAPPPEEFVAILKKMRVDQSAPLPFRTERETN